MRYPEFLKDGGCIAFAAPSFGAAEEPYRALFNNALRRAQAAGYTVDVGPNAYEARGVGISNTPEACAQELQEYYAAHGDVLVSVGGGELMCETLAALDLPRIAAAAPKWFLGYSDNTHFGFLLPTLWDVASLYGPNAPSFGAEPLHESLADCKALLTGACSVSHGYDAWELQHADRAENPLASYNLTEKTQVKAVHWDGGEISGRFLGGCLDVLENLCGTRFDAVRHFNERYGREGIVWFLEACDLNPVAIRRALWHLREAGWFSAARAFVFGRSATLAFCPEAYGMDEQAAVTAALGGLGVPLIMDADLGHLPPAMTMVNGGSGVLSPYGSANIQVRWTWE